MGKIHNYTGGDRDTTEVEKLLGLVAGMQKIKLDDSREQNLSPGSERRSRSLLSNYSKISSRTFSLTSFLLQRYDFVNTCEILSIKSDISIKFTREFVVDLNLVVFLLYISFSFLAILYDLSLESRSIHQTTSQCLEVFLQRSYLSYLFVR